MKNLLVALFLIFSSSIYAQSSARYSVNFTSFWSNETHPHPTNNFPTNAHWSKLVGATHSENITFFEMGGIATQGIENVAELGNNAVFFDEVNQAISNSHANLLIEGGNLTTGEGNIIIEDIITTENFPLISLVSMIAPSPDWIIAINSVSLLDVDGEWEDEIILDLYPYDAGTDNGMDYDSSNMDNNPHEPISSLQGVSPFSTEIIGTITITLEEVILSNSDFENNEAVNIYPNPSKDLINISTLNTELKSVDILNVLGKKVASYSIQNASQIQIDISDLANGIYVVRLVDILNKTNLKKIIKN